MYAWEVPLRPFTHYMNRAHELGLAGAAECIQQRTARSIRLASREWSAKVAASRRMTNGELLSRTTGGWPDIDSLLEHLVHRPGASFLLPFTAPATAAPVLLRQYPQYCEAVVAAADAACRGEFNVLGHHLTLGAEIDWHRDPITGKRWPLRFRERFDKYLWSSEPPADYIFSWELNRHQHLPILGVAYWLTNDSRYVELSSRHLLSWIGSNPPQYGIHWYSSLEIGLRLVAWTLAFQLFREAPLFVETVAPALLKSLYQQADFISNHLQVTLSTVPNNHLIGEATALVLLGAVFPEFELSIYWRQTGLALLRAHVPVQTHLDGVNKEQAAGYHQFVAEFLLWIAAIGRRGLLPHEPALEAALQGMSDYVMYMLTPERTIPAWGDSHNGHAVGINFVDDASDSRPLLAAGAALFGRADYKYAAGRFDEEAFWLLGVDGLAAWEDLEAHPPAQCTRAFPAAGIYALRDSWQSDSDAAFFRCGPFGLGGAGHSSHAHCDMLSVQLWIAGRSLLGGFGYLYLLRSLA